ncbi:hypothetical protein [Thioalkalivibrio sp. ALJT]|uniref:hypothetical protein n=1 Tax=Thioalkalivibrio sp. ALJT TaxID=1158146 RepID=UPI000377FE97|nr:hypothetical protein [Thioalkalivibrio sp. ALJT]
MVTENKRYNRLETSSDHIYLNYYGGNGVGNHEVFGYIKCKLAHTENASVIIPDQIFFNWDGELRWIQPFNFLPCVLVKDDDFIVCELYFDISCGFVVRARFFDNGFVRTFQDGSQLYKCKFYVPDKFGDHAIGVAKQGDDCSIAVQLFHHTKPETVDLINRSGALIGSRWNIQGNKELKDSDHVYFTPLHELKVNNDLEKIAMSSEARITLVRDGFEPPGLLFPGWEEAYKTDILIMEVYREDVSCRSATMDFWIPVELISPHHVIKHSPPNSMVYYEISAPFIHRVRICKGSRLGFSGSEITDSEAVRFHDKVIIGDGRTLEGLLAPFDEENTSQTFEIQKTDPQKTILEFWFDHANQDLYGKGNCHVIQPQS